MRLEISCLDASQLSHLHTDTTWSLNADEQMCLSVTHIHTNTWSCSVRWWIVNDQHHHYYAASLLIIPVLTLEKGEGGKPGHWETNQTKTRISTHTSTVSEAASFIQLWAAFSPSPNFLFFLSKPSLPNCHRLKMFITALLQPLHYFHIKRKSAYFTHQGLEECIYEKSWIKPFLAPEGAAQSQINHLK